MNSLEIAYIAGGCFWCTEAVFQSLNGVQKIVSGYMGGTVKNPAYREVCSGRTGHTEGIQVVFDPSIISFNEILSVFFATHDPTTLNRQGNDVGSQYRSSIFYTSEAQKEFALQRIAELEKTTFDAPIGTELLPETPFYKAEDEHLNYYKNNSNQPYCSYIIDPKIQKLKQHYQHLLK